MIAAPNNIREFRPKFFAQQGRKMEKVKSISFQAE
jgi:hypothetical protein